MGMTVDPAEAAATFEHEGTMYFFCSQGRETRFRTDPQKYLAPKPTAPPSTPPRQIVLF